MALVHMFATSARLNAYVYGGVRFTEFRRKPTKVLKLWMKSVPRRTRGAAYVGLLEITHNVRTYVPTYILVRQKWLNPT
jgi:hypothetical protein